MADKGIGGEKDNASKLLFEYMQKHGITENDLEQRVVKSHDVYLKPGREKDFFNQTCSNVLGKAYNFGEYVHPLDADFGQKRYCIDCTDVEFIEIKAKFDFFMAAYYRDEQIFYEAFVQKNHLYTKDGVTNVDELSADEIAHIMKVIKMSHQLEQNQYHRQIKSQN